MKFNSINPSQLQKRSGVKWSNYPNDVLPAWVADMDFAVSEPIQEALRDAVDRSDLGYPVSDQSTLLPDLFVDRVNTRYNWEIESHQVQMINDVVQGLYVSVLNYTSPGDKVIVQTPIYPPFLHMLKETGRLLSANPLKITASGYEIDFEHLEQLVDKETKLLAFCNPHNPTGRSFSRSDLETLADICNRYNILVVSDEIHADLVLDGSVHVPLASISDEIASRTTTLMSASKSFNIAGLCMAFVHFGSDELRAHFCRTPSHVLGGTNTLSIAAVKAAWTQSDDWLDSVKRQLNANRKRVSDFRVTNWPDVAFYPPEATYLAWFDMRSFDFSSNPKEHFLKHGRVALNDGADFGIEGIGFVRMNFATSPEILNHILARMDKALRI